MCIAMITLLNTLLKVVSHNIDYRFAGIKVLSAELWVAIFFFAVIVLAWRTFFRRSLLPLYIYGIAAYLMHLVGHFHYSAAPWIQAQVVPLFLSALLYELFVVKDSVNARRVVAASLIMLFVSLILNIAGLYKYPIAVREIVGRSMGTDLVFYYAKLGIEGYGFYSGLPPLIPVLVYATFKAKRKYLRYLASAMIVLIFIAIILCTITTPLILSLLGLFLSLIIRSLNKKTMAITVFSVMFALILIVTPIGVIRRTIPILISISPSDDVALRLSDIDYALSGNFEVTERSTELTSLEARMQRVYWNLGTFIEHPLFGSSLNNVRGSFHLFWLYLIATVGMVGTIPLLLFISITVRKNARRLSPEAKKYYYASFMLFVLMGVFKNITGWHMYMISFFIVPGLIIIVDSSDTQRNTYNNQG